MHLYKSAISATAVLPFPLVAQSLRDVPSGWLLRGCVWVGGGDAAEDDDAAIALPAGRTGSGMSTSIVCGTYFGVSPANVGTLGEATVKQEVR